ncbi:MAG: hypothetical protein Kow00121_09180 [Elainellaceae cyanobacterium]
MKPLVSILIPCYNAEKWLAGTIKSALGQTWKNIEVILVNDGSKDNSLAIAKQYESSRVKVIAQENQGQSAAENRALAEAQGDFIQYLDADDLLAPDKVERQIKLLTSGNPGYIASGEWGRFKETTVDAQFKPESVWQDMSPVDWLVCSWGGGGMMHGAAWLIPREVVDKAGPWNESLSLINDVDYFSRVLLASQGIKFCWGAKTYYRSGLVSNLSSVKSRAAFESAFRATELGTSHLLKHENSKRTRHACATKFQRFIYNTYPSCQDLVVKAEAKVQELGGTSLQPPGGPTFQLLAKMIGWKATKQLQQFSYSYSSRN